MADVQHGSFTFAPGKIREYPEHGFMRPSVSATPGAAMRSRADAMTSDGPYSWGNMGYFHVTDPEGRTGSPMFVAGTTADGVNQHLSRTELESLASILSQFDLVDALPDPVTRHPLAGAFRPPIGEPGPEASPGRLRVNKNASQYSVPHILAHELGHVVHSALPPSDIMPSSNARQRADPDNPFFFSGQTDQSRIDGLSDRTRNYLQSPQELFAESFRAYVQDPLTFKREFPEEAAKMRQLINESWLREYLMLSQNDLASTVAANSMVG